MYFSHPPAAGLPLFLISTLLLFSYITQPLAFELEDPLVHPPVDKRSSEEYEEFIKGSGRFPMGFGKRAYIGRFPTLSERPMPKQGDFGWPIVRASNPRQFIIATDGFPIVDGVAGWQEAA